MIFEYFDIRLQSSNFIPWVNKCFCFISFSRHIFILKTESVLTWKSCAFDSLHGHHLNNKSRLRNRIKLVGIKLSKQPSAGAFPGQRASKRILYFGPAHFSLSFLSICEFKAWGKVDGTHRWVTCLLHASFCAETPPEVSRCYNSAQCFHFQYYLAFFCFPGLLYCVVSQFLHHKTVLKYSLYSCVWIFNNSCLWFSRRKGCSIWKRKRNLSKAHNGLQLFILRS